VWGGGGGGGGERTTRSGAAPANARSETLELDQIHDVGQSRGRAGDVGDECEHPSAVAIEEEREQRGDLPDLAHGHIIESGPAPATARSETLELGQIRGVGQLIG
jgi:hypothetical protein